MAWLRLIRWKNLLIIFLTQFLAWRCVITPQLSGLNNGLLFLFSSINFICLAVSTILIAAAGYIINDYFDIKIDTINHPGKVILGTAIARKRAILFHTVLNIIALILAAYVAAQTYHFEWLLLQLCCTVLLWFYSTHFKRQYITGNVVVSLLTALTILILIIYNPTIWQASKISSGGFLHLPVYTLVVYAYFAFMLTWMREIVKDMEDLKGDEAEGCITMPIKQGLQYAIRFTQILSVLVIMPLSLASYLLFKYQYTFLSAYVFLFLTIPLCTWSLYLNKQSTSQQYHSSSKWLKIIMVFGILSLVIYYCQLYLSHATA